MRTTEDFDAFYLATARNVILHVYALCGDLAEAQDVAQEAYARAWQRWSTVSGYDDPAGWVRAVAWRLAANRWRSLRRWLRARARLEPPPPTPGPSPDRVAVVAALRQLPERMRQVVVLHYLYDQSIADIAQSTGIPAGTVKVYLSRARTRLAPRLSTSEEENLDVY